MTQQFSDNVNETSDRFARRHIGPSAEQQQQMLQTLGLSSLDGLIDQVIPNDIRLREPLALDDGLSEAQMLDRLRRLAERNRRCTSWIGQGYYNCHTPPVILRNVLENPGWYTAYTPYQPEISQGRLEALLNFQTVVSDLTGLALANASLLDEATAAAEAMTLCRRVSKNASARFFVAADCLPQTIDVVRTRAEPVGIEVVVGAPSELDGLDVFGALLQYPAVDGEIHDYAELCARVHQRNGLVAVATDLLSLTLLTPPGEFGADVAVGSSQRFGVPLGYGGPHAAFFATREEHKRALPGRLVGVSQDAAGRPAYRLALQTREQHIRREKATSNICTAQALLAIIAGFYAVYHGADGLTAIARRVHRLTATLAQGLRRIGYRVPTRHFFDTITIDAGSADAAGALLAAAAERGINLRRAGAGAVGVSLDETADAAAVETLWAVCAAVRDDAAPPSFDTLADQTDDAADDALPRGLRRRSTFLTHPVFARYRSETEMMRYLRRLMDRDLALDRAMIPLGSCTMKLNASAEMLPISWPEFAQIHPFAPAEQCQGYRALCDELERMLCVCTGYDAVSLQPNSGAQGEYAGLLTIRAYHRSRGDDGRDVCLIPSSAHGTNPASAQMAGMSVVVVGCDKNGNVDIDDLAAKAERHAARLAALMVTYPSTHGVFETAIREICDIVHRHGGQVYLDGANLNAQVGLCAPGRYGADVSHLNLHKTFCIPHGGGGPGVGPIGVRAHLAEFLPGAGAAAIGPVAAAHYGSAGILPISWAYIALMGADGLQRASAVAVLNANYIAERLRGHYPVLYTGAHGRVAHECIIDLRPLKDSAEVSVDDVAKRLIDYGFHAPTMSWPVAGTLMIEPTESESKAELDRFCDAMIAIRAEIAAIEQGGADRADNVLKNAPHTALALSDDDWSHPYSRRQAGYPAGDDADKYFAPVARVDNVYGDRHLVCSCPPLSDYDDDRAA